jgi:hypothetical protein
VQVSMSQTARACCCPWLLLQGSPQTPDAWQVAPPQAGRAAASCAGQAHLLMLLGWGCGSGPAPASCAWRHADLQCSRCAPHHPCCQLLLRCKALRTPQPRETACSCRQHQQHTQLLLQQAQQGRQQRPRHQQEPPHQHHQGLLLLDCCWRGLLAWRCQRQAQAAAAAVRRLLCRLQHCFPLGLLLQVMHQFCCCYHWLP